MLAEIYRAAYDARYKPCEHAAAHTAGLEAVVKHATTIPADTLRDFAVKIGEAADDPFADWQIDLVVPVLAEGFPVPLVQTPKDFSHSEAVLKRICEDLETEWGMAGLADDGLYGEYAKEVARRFAAGHGKTDEPVAWSFKLAYAMDRTSGEYTDWGPMQLSFHKPIVNPNAMRELTPLYSYPGTDLIPGRQWVEEAFAGFVNDPPSDDYQQGYLGALYVIAKEVFGMDVAADVPPPPAPSKPAPHLRLVKS